MSHLLKGLEFDPFRERPPWFGPDLQTLRNTLRARHHRPDWGLTHRFTLPDGDQLLARWDSPQGAARGLVVVVHGLGGGSDDEGQRRLGRSLCAAGFAVLRLNLRGAGPGRPLAKGTYAANCNRDLLPVLVECRRLATDLAPSGEALPLGAVGLSLGGTVLLNALLGHGQSEPPLLDAVVCISSPLDLQSCAACIERPRNRVYQAWLVRRLIQQTLADPQGLPEQEQQGLRGLSRPRTIRAFDALITAPRWDFPSVLAYYQACSPLPRLRQGLVGPAVLPRLLLVQARDDPWVPVEPLLSISEEIRVQREHGSREVWPDVLITDRGGHNGFHAPGDSPDGCWSDRLAAHWLHRVLVQPAST